MPKTFQNNPNIAGSENGQIKRYVHQPLAVDHYGIRAQIKSNGKIVISGQPVQVLGKDGKPTGESEYDEVEIPASLVFKLASLLKATRSIEYVAVGSAPESQEELNKV